MLYDEEVPGSEHPFYRMGFIVVAPIESQENKITGSGDSGVLWSYLS